MQKSNYRAFISYSQQDKAWAKKLHQALESFRVPLGVVADIDPKSRKIGRVFRDDDEMGASEDLSSSLEKALAASECLIVLCSPNSAKSKWVDLEVRRYKQNPDARVFAVIIDGTPNSEDIGTECFCPSLRFRITPAGEITDTPEEPLAPDWRKEGKMRLTTRLTAGILNIPFDSLWQRVARRRRSRNRLFVGASLIFSLILSAFAVISLNRANFNNAEELAAFSFKALEDSIATTLPSDPGSNAERGLRFAVLAARKDWLHPSLPYALDVLEDASRFSRGSGQLIGHDGPVLAAAFMPGGSQLVTAGDDKTIKVWDIAELKLLHSTNIPGKVLSFSADGKFMVYADEKNKIYLGETVDPQNTVFLNGHNGKLLWARFDTLNKYLVTTDQEGSVIIWDVHSGEALYRLQSDDRNFYTAFLSSDDSELITAAPGYISIWNLSDEITLRTEIPVMGGHLLEVSSNSGVLKMAMTDGQDNISAISMGAGLGAPPASLMRGHQGPVTSFVILNGGGVSTSLDGTARLWISMGIEFARLQGHEAGILSSAISPDQMTLVTTSIDGTARLWDLSSREGDEWAVSPENVNVRIKQICNQKTGQLRGQMRLITAADVAAMPSLKGKEELDVCVFYFN